MQSMRRLMHLFLRFPRHHRKCFPVLVQPQRVQVLPLRHLKTHQVSTFRRRVYIFVIHFPIPAVILNGAAHEHHH